MKLLRINKSQFSNKDVNEQYEWCKDVNQGTYGSVYKAKNKKTNQNVALKKIKFFQDNYGFPITALREIQILKQLSHPNIIQLEEIVTTQTFKKDEKISIYLVMDYYEHDFESLIKNKIKFTLSQIKYITYQILQGLQYLHDKMIIHRDLKAANIFYKNDGNLVLADFGLAKKINNQKLTNKVVTLWYRAPELLLGSKSYSNKIDIWSLGCFFFEILTGEILFPGKQEKDQLQLIYEKCGSELYHEAQFLPYFQELESQIFYPNKLKQFLFSKILSNQTQTIDFLEKMLCLDPEKRISAKDALNHSFFQTLPIPCKQEEMPKFNQQDFHGSSIFNNTIEQNYTVQTDQKLKFNKYNQNKNIKKNNDSLNDIKFHRNK